MTDPSPSQAAGTGAPRNAAIERLLRRSLLALMRDGTTTQDRLDFADLADAVGATAIATVVRDAAMLRRGFGSDGANSSNPQDSIERAVAELAEAMRDCPPDAILQATDIPDASDAPAACAQLARLLAAPYASDAALELARLLAAWRGLAERTSIDAGDEVDADLKELVVGYATYELQAFLNRNHSLAFAPCGSANLLHFAARLTSGGLGPYFSEIGNVVRGSQDVLGLIARAAGQQAVEKIECWVIPLASRLPETVAIAVAEDLADLGLTGAVRALLLAAVRRRDGNNLIQHLRDAALDLGDDAAAMSAQQAVLTRAPYDFVEWRRMAAIQVAAGDEPAAEAALLDALRLSPGDKDTIAQLQALRDGDFSAFTVEGGFMTPSLRKRLRLARRAA